MLFLLLIVNKSIEFIIKVKFKSNISGKYELENVLHYLNFLQCRIQRKKIVQTQIP